MITAGFTRLSAKKGQLRLFSDISSQYQKALAAISDKNSPPRDVSNATKLKMYAFFKQIDAGPCTGSRPGMFDLVGRAKYDAWADLGKMSKEDAMKGYVKEALEIFDGKIPETGVASNVDSYTTAGQISTSPPKKVSVATVAFPKQYQAGVDTLGLTTVLAEQAENGVQHVILNRPKRGNAFDMKLWEDYQRVFEYVSNSTEARAVILSGAGGNFSTGMDLSVFADMQSCGSKESCEGRRREGIAKFIQYLQDATSSPETCAVPVIAAIAGHCIGGGIDIITACDLRYCTKDASFCVKEIDLAIVADMGTLQRLPRIVGDQRAAELTYTGRTFNGQEAKEMGLVLECFDTEADMMKHVSTVAAQIASKSPITTRGVKQSILFSREHTVKEGMQHVKMWNSAYLQSDDLMEAMRAVMSKDEATFHKN